MGGNSETDNTGKEEAIVVKRCNSKKKLLTSNTINPSLTGMQMTLPLGLSLQDAKVKCLQIKFNF